MPGHIYTDNVGHLNRHAATALTAGAVSTSAVGTISPTTSAGASPTVTFATGFVADDVAGSFELNPVTGGGSQAAGQVALVRFANSYAKPPAAVLVSIYNVTDSTATLTANAGNVWVAGFDVYVSGALTTAKDYRISYWVIPQP